jgi:PBSX family phage terminase large subunit
MPKEVKIALTASQIEFLKLDCPFPAFFGGYGCGKSYLMTVSAVFDAMHSSDSVVAIYEPEYALIRDVVVPYLERWMAEFGITGHHNKQDHAIYTSSSKIGDFVMKSMDNPNSIVGYESYRAHVDELDTLPMDKAQEVWFKIMGRNRQRPTGVSEEYMKFSDKNNRLECINKISAYSTPEGFKFCHKQWGTGNNKDFQYVKGRTEDNPELNEAYITQLKESYPPALVDAYMHGEFVNMTSGTVYNCYDRKAHDSYEVIRSGEPLYIGCDFNVTNQAATVWVKREGGYQWHAVEELTGMYDTPEMIKIITERWKNKGHTITVYPDASGSARHTTNACVSDIALLKLAGFRVNARNKNPSVRDRVQATNNAFNKGRLKVNSRKCPNVANCLEQQAYDKNGEPDKKSGFDHQNDATTYPIAYEMMINKPLYSVPIRWVS